MFVFNRLKEIIKNKEDSSEALDKFGTKILLLLGLITTFLFPLIFGILFQQKLSNRLVSEPITSQLSYLNNLFSIKFSISLSLIIFFGFLGVMLVLYLTFRAMELSAYLLKILREKMFFNDKDLLKIKLIQKTQHQYHKFLVFSVAFIAILLVTYAANTTPTYTIGLQKIITPVIILGLLWFSIAAYLEVTAINKLSISYGSRFYKRYELYRIIELFIILVEMLLIVDFLIPVVFSLIEFYFDKSIALLVNDTSIYIETISSIFSDKQISNTIHVIEPSISHLKEIAHNIFPPNPIPITGKYLLSLMIAFGFVKLIIPKFVIWGWRKSLIALSVLVIDIGATYLIINLLKLDKIIGDSDIFKFVFFGVLLIISKIGFDLLEKQFNSATIRTCPKCDEEQIYTNKFCPHCGQRLAISKQTSTIKKQPD